MMASLSNKYERLKKILEELEIDQSFLLPEQDPSLLRRKRKVMELEHQLYIVGLHCQRELPEGVMFANNLVETKTLIGYKVMASNVKTNAKQRSSMLMSKIINERPDKDRILRKRVKLESLGYTHV
ncbi:hypothetical protein Tco_1334521 [Tanacetum coccineum]